MTGIEHSPAGRHKAVLGAGRIRSDTNRRGKHMEKAVFALVAALGLVLAFPVSAVADHAGEWIPYDAEDPAHASSIVDPTTVELAIEDPEEAPLGTSVEIADLDHEVGDNTEVTFEYEEIEGAECGKKQVRVFVSGEGIGSAKDNNSWDQNQPDGTQCGEGGKVTFTIESAGTIEAAGVVYGSGERAPGVVRVSNLMIGEHVVHFENPEPILIDEGPMATVATCDESGSITFPEVENMEWVIDGDTYDSGITHPFEPGEYTVDPTQVGDNPPPVDPEGEDPSFTVTVEAEDCDEPSSEPTEDESTDEPESTTTDDATPASSQETLPDTGVSPLMLAGGALVLILAGAGLLLSKRAN